MDGFGWIGTIILGGLAGWIASILLKVKNNIFMNIILGIIGAVVLNFLLVQLFHVEYGGIVGQLITAIIGAALVMLVFRAVTGRNI